MGFIHGYWAPCQNLFHGYRVEKGMWQKEQQNRKILDGMIDQICCCDHDMRILWANKAFLDWVGTSMDAVAGQLCYRIVKDRDSPCEECPGSIALRTGRMCTGTMVTPDFRDQSRFRDWELYAIPLSDESGALTRFVEVARDVTDRKENMNQIQGLTRQLLHAQEAERQMIARELHDGIAQDLAAYKMSCLAAAKACRDLSTPLAENLQKVADGLQNTLTAVRNLSYSLRPPALELEGIVETLAQYCEDAAKISGIEIRFSSAGMRDLALDTDMMIGLYRLVQEGIRNTRKHAHASRITVQLTAAFPNIVLSIDDNGEGFDVEARRRAAPREKRMGLQSMEERVKLLGGTFSVKSEPGKGTSIRILLPRKEQDGV